MVRGYSIALGIGLAILWIAGLSSPAATAWMAWLDAAGALCAFGIAAAAARNARKSTLVGSTLALSVGLFALWLIGLGSDVVGWLSWWTFAFACAFLILGISAIGTRETRPVSGVQKPEEIKSDTEKKREEQHRRSA